MATNRRRYVRGRREALIELTPELRVGLTHGLFIKDYDLDTLRECWEMHADEILAEWETENPGTRPWAWWEFDAPEPRRIVNHPKIASSFETESRKRGGQILIGGGPNAIGNNPDFPDLVPWLEEEADYLARLKLD